jgi:hypothetical protein
LSPSRERRAPVSKDAGEAVGVDMFTHSIFRHEGQAIADKGGLDGHGGCIEH